MTTEEDSMTGSYSEIWDEERGERERPRELGPGFLAALEGQGMVSRQGALVSFVASDLEAKIKLTSPTEPSPALAMIEAEALRLAASVDSLAENLAEILHGASALTVDCLEAYRDVVCKTCDAVDLNIKSMYQLVAKSEELGKSMAPLYQLAANLKNINHLLDLIEAS